MFVEINTNETPEVYTKRIYNSFQEKIEQLFNMINLLKFNKDLNKFETFLLENSIENIYVELAKIKEISNSIEKYIYLLERSDMELISLLTDTALNGGQPKGDISNRLKNIEGQDLNYQFILICIIWLKHIHLPFLKKNKKRE